ncbi:3-phosphoshikimate 1-carboxyvinyltransferase [Sphingosinicella sp. BN140058]|uniref:3-phosphoshikimate 1-carboxyvinyltransferase n=1 Tax=Sphingosinicella sp. BN140058 TaxID=1892855 RepID=UPI0010104D0B|nr:3-phosphoshikimate 1-carboxyvinyltransferase [Sphingosinicella sp. BN140058]
MHHEDPQPMEFGPRGPLKGVATVPGDKSISHRALMFSALARGRSRIEGLSGGGDVMSTAAAMRAMGATINRTADGAWEVDGVGTGCLLQPETALDMGNSGTSTRLLMGLVASHPITATFVGDASLSKRPMNRVIDPLRKIGAEFTGAPGGRLPLTVRGLSPAAPASHVLQVASAQVKSALLLAGLNTPGVTRVFEPIPTRDHSERMLRHFGVNIRVEERDGGRDISLSGQAELQARPVTVPGDPSSAAFLAAAALIVPGSDVLIRGVSVNPLRAGLFELLQLMGGDLVLENPRDADGEPVADLRVRHSRLRAVTVPDRLVPSMIDEFPIWFVTAAFAEGTSRADGLGELRVKESDRISAMASGLTAIGVRAEESPEGLAIEGNGGAPVRGGGTILSQLDHRIAMSFAIAGLHAERPIGVDDMAPVATSFPPFLDTIESLAA